MTATNGKVLTWHASCLQCNICRVKPIQLDNVVFNADKLFCKPCYLNEMLDKCNKCKKVG